MLYIPSPGRCQTQTRSINGGEGRLSFEDLHFYYRQHYLQRDTSIYKSAIFSFHTQKAYRVQAAKPFICKSLVNTGYLRERSSWVHTHTQHIHTNKCMRTRTAGKRRSSHPGAAGPAGEGEMAGAGGAGPGLGLAQALLRHKRGLNRQQPGWRLPNPPPVLPDIF